MRCIVKRVAAPLVLKIAILGLFEDLGYFPFSILNKHLCRTSCAYGNRF